jgi:hypothetical protein
MSRLLIFFLIPFTALAQLANRPPAPLWLSSAGAVMISKDVRHEGKLLKAVLLTASDADMEISVDGKLVAKVKAAESATGTDLTKQLSDGQSHQLGLRVPAKAKSPPCSNSTATSPPCAGS